MIKSFKCRETRRLYHRQQAKTIPANIQRMALRKLCMLDAAESLEDLRSPPGNRLKALRGDRQGQHSIRINDLRICFVCRGTDAFDVEIADYR